MGSPWKALDGELLRGGAGPLSEILAPVLATAAANLLLFVDQFEEVFRFGLRSKDPARKKEAAELVR